MNLLTHILRKSIELGLVPESILRFSLALWNRERLKRLSLGDVEAQHEAYRRLLRTLSQSPIVMNASDLGDDPVELPPRFFQLVLGRQMKFGCCYYPTGSESLNDAEETMLWLASDQARVRDGMSILNLGCGWGAQALWLARNYPAARITAVTDSISQSIYVEKVCRDQQIPNVEVVHADLNAFTTENRFDRVLALEMFDRVRNFPHLFKRIATWLKTDGLLFLQLPSHREFAYVFEPEDFETWSGKLFRAGGLMAADDLLLHFQEDLICLDHWRLSGSHLQRTADAWILNMEQHEPEILEILENAHGPKQVAAQWQRWRLTLMACAEIWGFRRGQEWVVSHYLFGRR